MGERMTSGRRARVSTGRRVVLGVAQLAAGAVMVGTYLVVVTSGRILP